VTFGALAVVVYGPTVGALLVGGNLRVGLPLMGSNPVTAHTQDALRERRLAGGARVGRCEALFWRTPERF
jgi:hypothetical protein